VRKPVNRQKRIRRFPKGVKRPADADGLPSSMTVPAKERFARVGAALHFVAGRFQCFTPGDGRVDQGYVNVGLLAKTQ